MSPLRRREQRAEYRNQSVAQLAAGIRAAEKKLASLRFDHASRKLKNIRELAAARKSIAVMQTIVHEKIASSQAGKESQ